MAEKTDGGANNAIWAVTTLLIAVLILSLLYFGGVLGDNGRNRAGDINGGAQSIQSAH